MNIQGANLLSLLSGSEGLDNLPQTLAGINGVKPSFASALMEQLKLLQGASGGDINVAAPDISLLQDWVDAAKTGNAPPDLQGFADLFGKNLPLAKRVSPDIDLEDTLQTLASVLQQLQQLETGAVSMPELPITEDVDIQQPIASEPDQQAVDAIALTNALAMPAHVPVTETDEMSEPSVDEPELAVVLADAKKSPALSNPQVQNQNTPLSDTVVSADALAADFDRSISAMLAGSDGKSPPGKPAVSFKAESLMDQIETQPEGGDLGKSLSGVSAEIAKLNQAVRGDSQAASLPQPSMFKPFADPAWSKELAEKLIWMHKQAIPSVELRLNPQHLGPVLVKIDVNQDQASVAFTAQHLAVKEALEAAIPKLREMLGGQQLNLLDVNVSQQQSDQRQAAHDFFQMASGQGRGRHEDLNPNGNGPHNDAQDLVDEIEAGRAIASNGLLSLFA